MNKKTVALDQEEYRKIITSIQNGFTYLQDGEEKRFRPNRQLATILQLEANLGLRISDVLALTMASIKKDGSRHRLDIVERKTGKSRTFTVPDSIYTFLLEYSYDIHAGKDDKLFNIGERAVQKQLKIVCDHLQIETVSTHSFRKTFATYIYQNSDHDIELVCELLQHSSIRTTRRYIGISDKDKEAALQSVADKFQIQ